jgi:hypothetical protein
MLEVNLFDREFIHTEQLLGYITCSDRLKPTKIKWINGLMKYDGITIFTDNFINNPLIDTVESKIKIFWLLEPRAVNPIGYQRIVDLENKFDYILTYDKDLLSKGGKYIEYVVAQSRVSDLEAGIHPKSKLVSMIASNKTFTEGHRYRHEIISALQPKHNFDLWGSGYKPFGSKNEPLKDYYFSISVMNSKVDNFFTEVLVDNFRLGTIPIFWGCPNIGKFFDERGIIVFDTIEELDDILKNLTIQEYHNRFEYIQNNLESAKKYVSTDDIIADILKTI